MEGLGMLPLVIIGMLLALDVVALMWGADSRPSVVDNRRWWPGRRYSTGTTGR